LFYLATANSHSVSIQQMTPARLSQNLTTFAPVIRQTSRWNHANFSMVWQEDSEMINIDWTLNYWKFYG